MSMKAIATHPNTWRAEEIPLGWVLRLFCWPETIVHADARRMNQVAFEVTQLVFYTNAVLLTVIFLFLNFSPTEYIPFFVNIYK